MSQGEPAVDRAARRRDVVTFIAILAVSVFLVALEYVAILAMTPCPRENSLSAARILSVAFFPAVTAALAFCRISRPFQGAIVIAVPNGLCLALLDLPGVKANTGQIIAGFFALHVALTSVFAIITGGAIHCIAHRLRSVGGRIWTRVLVGAWYATRLAVVHFLAAAITIFLFCPHAPSQLTYLALFSVYAGTIVVSGPLVAIIQPPPKLVEEEKNGKAEGPKVTVTNGSVDRILRRM